MNTSLTLLREAIAALFTQIVRGAHGAGSPRSKLPYPDGMCRFSLRDALLSPRSLRVRKVFDA